MSHLPMTGPSTPLIVLTGGPGAGKTAVLEVVRMHHPARVEVVPEAARIVFGGGFPRRPTLPARRAAQRSIFRVQQQLEGLAVEEAAPRVVLCDRGTLDSAAYWPGTPDDLCAEMGTTYAAEIARYAAVIHLRPPSLAGGFRSDSVRIESASEAAQIDRKIEEVWSRHPRRIVVGSTADFFEKLTRVLGIIREELDRLLPVEEEATEEPSA